MRLLFHILFCFLTAFLLPLTVPAQEVSASLEFQADTLAIGRAVPLRMAVEHPDDVVIIFPNQKRSFVPFELVSLQAEPTRTVNNRSWDVVTYYVRSFEVEPIQSIDLYFGYLSGTDTTWQYIVSDSIRFNERVREYSEKLPYKAFEGIVELEDPSSYQGLLIIGLILGGIGLIVFIALRRPIHRYLKLRNLKNEWLSIRRKLRKLESLEDQTVFYESVNNVWKSYLDPDESLALRSLTTTELRTEITRLDFLSAEQQRSLIQTSLEGDQVIYADNPLPNYQPQQRCQELQRVIEQVYFQRKAAFLAK